MDPEVERMKREMLLMEVKHHHTHFQTTCGVQRVFYTVVHTAVLAAASLITDPCGHATAP